MKRTTAEKRRGQRQHRKQVARNLARLTSKLSGCTCDPDITGGPGHITARHDSWCPMTSAPSQLVVYRPEQWR